MRNISQVGIALIKKYEGCKLKPYLCPAGKATIGWGSCYYADGTPVAIGDKAITQAQADELLLATLETYVEAVNYLTKQPLNQFQFDALCSFCYNVGVGNFKMSTLLKLININPNDPKIESQFLRWNKVNKKVLIGLTARRQYESDTYFRMK